MKSCSLDVLFHCNKYAASTWTIKVSTGQMHTSAELMFSLGARPLTGRRVRAQQTKNRLFEVASHRGAAVGLLWLNQLFLRQLSEPSEAPTSPTPPSLSTVPLHMSPAGLRQHESICMSSSNVIQPMVYYRVQLSNSEKNTKGLFPTLTLSYQETELNVKSEKQQRSQQVLCYLFINIF